MAGIGEADAVPITDLSSLVASSRVRKAASSAFRGRKLVWRVSGFGTPVRLLRARGAPGRLKSTRPGDRRREQTPSRVGPGTGPRP
jgi:hypothetical protein